MKTKKYLYAAVGAPVAVAKATQNRVDEIRTRITESADTLTKDIDSQIETWASEGRQLFDKLGESKAIDEISDRVDFEQMQAQVGKLRDQLEDLLDTWRSSFRPGERNDVVQKITVEEAPKPEAPKPEAKKPAAKKPAAKKPAAKKPAAKKPAAKKPAASSTAAKKTATKADTAKAESKAS